MAEWQKQRIDEKLESADRIVREKDAESKTRQYLFTQARAALISENEVRYIRCFLPMEFTSLNPQAQNSALP